MTIRVPVAPFLQITTRNGSAFGLGAIVGVLGGLIGLGGAEFRLPILVGWFRYSLLSAVLINLFVSLVTVIVSLGFRAQIQGFAPLLEQWPVAFNILAGSLVGSYAGVHMATRISERALIVTVSVILVFLGLLLMGNDWLFSHDPLILDWPVRMIVGILAGLIIGVVSSLLGVAGGELIIPTLTLFFGLDIKLAGSVSLMISIPTIMVGILRYRTRPVFHELKHDRRVILFMALGSVLGAAVGSQLLPYAPSSLLKMSLGFILLFSAVKISRTRSYVGAKKAGGLSLNLLDQFITDAVRDYVARHKDAHPEQAAAVERLGALPLWVDWGGGVAIRPDGELIGFYWDDPASAKIETDPHLRFLAQVVGAQEHVELAFLAPKRSLQDRDCPFCDGSGRIRDLEKHGIDPKGFRCYCGGAGWLPHDVPDLPGLPNYDFE